MNLTGTFVLPEGFLSEVDAEKLSAHPYYRALCRFRRAAKILQSQYRRDQRQRVLRACGALHGIGKADMPPRLYIDFLQWRDLADRLDGNSSNDDFATCERTVLSLAEVLERYFRPKE